MGKVVFFTDNANVYNDANELDYPTIKNCILWYNNDNAEQYTGFTKSCIAYSCVYDPNNDPTGTDLVKDANYNFTPTKPNFAYTFDQENITDPNNISNVHIVYESPCRDAGDPNLFYIHQVDMDEQVRVVGLSIDIGARRGVLW